jgi:hypothetical protein
MKSLLGIYNFINNNIKLKIYQHKYIQIINRFIILLVFLFINNISKFVVKKKYFNKNIYNTFFWRRIYLKPLKHTFNLLKIDFSGFWINYVEKEKVEFFFTENYGNVSSIKYDLRTYPFWILKIFKIDIYYLMSKIPEIKILPFLKKIEIFIRSIKINLIVTIPDIWFLIWDFFQILNLKKIFFNLFFFKLKNIYYLNNLLLKFIFFSLFYNIYIYIYKLYNKIEVILINNQNRVLKFKKFSKLYFDYLLKLLTVIIININIKYYYYYYFFFEKKKVIIKLFNFKFLYYYLILLLWVKKNYSEKIYNFFLIFLKLIWFIIISVIEPYVKINFWKNKFSYKKKLIKKWLINFFHFFKNFIKTIKKNLKRK